nr:zinc ribbon domain-containing protein [Clostridioides mangenotii]
MEKKQFECPKCGSNSYEHDQFQATGGILQKFLMSKIRNLLL